MAPVLLERIPTVREKKKLHRRVETWPKSSSTRKITDPVVPTHRVTLKGSETGIPSDPPCIVEKMEEDPALTVH